MFMWQWNRINNIGYTNVINKPTNFQSDWNSTVINKPTNFQSYGNSTVSNKPDLTVYATNTNLNSLSSYSYLNISTIYSNLNSFFSEFNIINKSSHNINKHFNTVYQVIVI